MNIIKTSSLFFTEGSSDKIYHVEIVEENEEFFVNFRFGKRNTKLQMGTKTTSPVEFEKAEKIYEKLIKEKTSKGYTFDEIGTPFHRQNNVVRTMYLPQLLNPIQERELEKYLKDDLYIAQQKIDGIRIIVELINDQVTAYNRSGIEVKLASTISDELIRLGMNLILDGELVKDKYYVFDLLNDQVDIRDLPLIDRFNKLFNYFKDFTSKRVTLVNLIEGYPQKLEFFDTLKITNAEGIVFKHKNSPYEAGRPNSFGNQLKFKFVTSASVIVTRLNDKQSVSIALKDGDKVVDVGNVRIPPNAIYPKPNDIIEVQYLYAFKDTSKLFQPVYLSQRIDVNSDECNIEQLKYKEE